MLLKEAAPAGPVPSDDVAAHLRLSFGFADDGAEDALIAVYLRAAVAAVEMRTGQALLARGFVLQVTGWDRRGRLTLPVGPVAAIDAIRFVWPDRSADLAPGEWALEPGTTRQRLGGAGGGALRAVPAGAVAELEFTAGHGAGWDDVPGDLRQAVLLLAAHYYENRQGDLPERGGLPPAVEALLAPHRPVRL